MAGRKLKVFQAQFGFYDTVVAASSQAAALKAWGTRQNLFASGDAKVTTDEAAAAAALEHPETPLRRAVGSSDPFLLEPTSLPTVPDAPKRASAKPNKTAKAAAPAKPPVDRSKLDAAEETLRSLDEGRKKEEAEFGKKRTRWRLDVKPPSPPTWRLARSRRAASLRPVALIATQGAPTKRYQA